MMTLTNLSSVKSFKFWRRKAPGSIPLLVFLLILLRNRSKKSTKDRERKKKSDGRYSVANSFKEIEQEKWWNAKGKRIISHILGKGQGFLYFIWLIVFRALSLFQFHCALSVNSADVSVPSSSTGLNLKYTSIVRHCHQLHPDPPSIVINSVYSPHLSFCFSIPHFQFWLFVGTPADVGYSPSR